MGAAGVAADGALGDAGGRIDLEEAGAAVGAAEEARAAGGGGGAAPHAAHGTGTTGKGRGGGTGHHGCDNSWCFLARHRRFGAWAAAVGLVVSLWTARDGGRSGPGDPWLRGRERPLFEALDRSRRCGSVTCELYLRTGVRSMRTFVRARRIGAGHDRDDLLAVAIELHRADARHAAQLRDRARATLGDGLDRAVVEHDERRDRVGASTGRAPGTERVRERRPIAGGDLGRRARTGGS